MTFGAGANGIATPDKPYPRPVLWCIRVFNRKIQLSIFQLMHDVLDDLFLIGSAVSGMPRAQLQAKYG